VSAHPTVGILAWMTTWRPPRPRQLPAAALLATALLLTGCSLSEALPRAGDDGAASGGGRPADVAPLPDDTPSGWGPTEGEIREAADRVSELTVAEQAATVLMPGFWGYSATEPTPVEVEANQRMHGADSAVEVMREHGFGTFFLRPEVIADATQVGELAESLQAVADDADGLPALLSIDQEGGAVQRLSVGVETVPSASYVGSTGDPDYARQVALENGRTLAALGVTMVMAPVAGVDPDGTSALGSRIYGSDPETVSRMVAATVEGYLDAGVIPVVKHFPGLGSVDGDSHVMLPAQYKTVAELQEVDLRPFVTAIEQGAPVLMTGHVDVQALDPGVPASLSPEVVQGLLRDTLGFEGVVVTDSQGMGPVHARYGSGEGAVLSLLAGNDLVLNSPEPLRALDAVEQAVVDGRLSEERLAEAATRVFALRLYQQRLAGTAG
jgi:beta-N-acetylhexosaminidase